MYVGIYIYTYIMSLSNIYKNFIESVGKMIYYIKNTFEYFRKLIMKEKKREKKRQKKKKKWTI